MQGKDLQFLKQRGFADFPIMSTFRFSVPDLLQQNRAVILCLESFPPIHLSPFNAKVFFGSN
jgi:hypothetical protein